MTPSTENILKCIDLIRAQGCTSRRYELRVTSATFAEMGRNGLVLPDNVDVLVDDASMTYKGTPITMQSEMA